MAFVIAHYGIVLSLALFIVSDLLAVVQYLKYPTNSGVGGVLVAIAKFLKSVGAQDIPRQDPPSA